MIQRNKIKGAATQDSVFPVKRMLKRQCMDENSIYSPFFRPKKLSRIGRNATDVLNFALLTPTRENDLAVHRMKLEELKKWLRITMSVNRGPKTLLLTGPSGSGKTSALRVLCAEFGIEVNEFDCTEEFGGETAPPFSGAPSFSKRSGESQLDGFIHFIRSNEFSSIQNMSLKHRLLLIAQLPNAFYRDPSKLHSVLANVLPSSRCLIAFVLANVDACWELSPFRLFPASLVEQFQITHIKFNPIADSLLTAAMKRIFRLTELNWDAELAKQIVNCANGDIRRALNTLLFSLIKIDRSKRIDAENCLAKESFQQKSSLGRPKQLSTQKPLELFHFIGKILYAKRIEEKSGVKNKQIERWKRTEQKLGQKLCEKYGRPMPPKDELNQLIAAAPIGGQSLIGFIYEHEPRFSPSLSALTRINSTIASLDVINRQFGVENERMADKYAMEIAVRSSIFHNYSPAIEKAHFRRTFYHLEKPRFHEMDAQRHDQRKRMAEGIGTERTAQMETLVVPLLTEIRARDIASTQQTLSLMVSGFTALRAGCATQPKNAIVLPSCDSSIVPEFDADDGQNYEIDDSESGDEARKPEIPLQLDMSLIFIDEK